MTGSGIDCRPDDFSTGFPDLAAILLGEFGRAGYEFRAHGSIRAPDWDTTLFVSGGIQNWRSWVLGSHAAGEGRVGAQWCVRANRLDDIGTSMALTSFCMISAVRLGARPRRVALEELMTALEGCGIPLSRLAFITTMPTTALPSDEESASTLAALGISPDRITSRAQRWAQPFRPYGPTGPNLFILAETGPPCSANCSPLCRCGRFVHFWNCEFLDYMRLSDNTLQPAPTPVVDSAGSLEWLACAVAGKLDVRAAEPLRRAADAVLALVARAAPEFDIADAELTKLVDHGRTVALLLASGLEPGSRAHGHVLRRLVRRMLTTLVALTVEPTLLTPVIVAASQASAGQYGFPGSLDVRARVSRLDGEVAGFRVAVARGRREYAKARERADTAADLAEALFRIKAEQGVPLPVLLAWCRADDRPVCDERIATLLADERAVSRQERPRHRVKGK